MNFKPVAVIEVPIRTPSDRKDLLIILRNHAAASGADMVDNSADWQQFERQIKDPKPDPASVLHKTLYAGLFGDYSDRDPLVELDDGGHEGRPWLIFFNGLHPKKAANLRHSLTRVDYAPLAGCADIPIMPNGGLPLDNDLIWTGHDYVVKPGSVATYRPSTYPSQ